MGLNKFLLLIFLLLLLAPCRLWAQCSGQIMEPGFQFLTSSRGCAPFTVEIETRYLSSTPGTRYTVNWGDGTATENYTQTNATGVIITHTYPNTPVECGYDVTIDAQNTCNPLGSVIPINTQVVVWTNDIVSINPGEFRVCQGFATSLQFTDNSDWNCHPRDTRENSEARWIQWIYGTGPAANRIPGMTVNGVTPGAFPYLNPAPGNNPIYPVTAPGRTSLSINVPATTPADIGKEFVVTLKNWNQCNPYDNLLTDGNAFNPVNGNLVDGDNAPQVTTARVVIVPSPDAAFVTRLGSATGPLQTVFCVGDDIYFDNETDFITGAAFRYRWEFYDNSTGTGTPLLTSTTRHTTTSYTTTGQKLIRLIVQDNNAAGNCESTYETLITVSPSLQAKIGVSDLTGNPLTTDFCQEAATPFTNFPVRFRDVSVGTVLPSTQWRWEFYNENNTLVLESPVGGGFSSTALGPFDRTFINKGIYRVRLRVRDGATSCESVDEVSIRVFEKPQPIFTTDRVCAGNATTFTDASTVDPLAGEQIVLREWDLDYNGTTFTKDPALDNETTFEHTFATAGTHRVALRVTTDLGSCSDIVVRDVRVDPVPNASITADKVAGCSRLDINFTNNAIAPGVVTQYIWEIDNGNGTFSVDSVQRPTEPGFGPIFTRTFVNNGTADAQYRVRLRIRTVSNCEAVSAPVTITVFPGSHAGFVSLNYSPFDDNCSPVDVNFSVDAATQALNPTGYTWSISDAAGPIEQINIGTTPSFTYTFRNTTSQIKDFSVTLEAELSSGCSGDSTRTIRVNPLPVSDFTIDTVTYNCDKMTIRVDASQKGLEEYAWRIIINGTPVYATSTAGDNFEYEIERSTALDKTVRIGLITTNLTHCKSVETLHDIVVPRNSGFNASFTATPTSQTLPNATVTINNTTVAGPWEYLWDFGDGTTSTSATVTNHTYETFGTFTITLTVKDNDCIDQQVVMVEILPMPPIVDFEYFPGSGCAPLTVDFKNLSQYADNYFWEFGTGEGTSTETDPSHTYFKPGIYTVTLFAGNAIDTVAVTKPMIIEVFESPMAQFAVYPRVLNVPGDILYTNNKSQHATSYVWDFGDNTTSTEAEPQHKYKDEGIFTIQLVATSANGCSDTLRMASAVQTSKQGQLLIPNAFSPSTLGPGSSNLLANEVFLPMMRGVSKFQMMVFNRWGTLMFESSNPEQGWDGYYQGRLCQQDVYIYKIVVEYDSGRQLTKTGDINLIR